MTVPNAAYSRVRATLAKSPVLKRVHGQARRTRNKVRWVMQDGTFASAPSEQAVRLAYNVMLRREPDPVGAADFTRRLDAGVITFDDMVEELRGSEEFIYGVPFRHSFGHSIHSGRCAWIQSLPAAKRILDLGGTHSASDFGAMVRMGYPYPFDELTIIDLPDEERHELYQVGKEQKDVESPLGMVRHRYHSMVDLSDYADNSVDLVYSGQSIEHVSLEEGDKVLAEVYRVLRPGGHFALDTPNARVTRQQQAEFIDPDHEHEYTYEELREKLERAGFNILEAKGLNYAGPPTSKPFTLEKATGNPGLFAETRDCYILAFLCSK